MADWAPSIRIDGLVMGVKVKARSNALRFLTVYIFYTAFICYARAGDVVLPVIKVTGNAADALADDGSVPAQEVRGGGLSSRGSSARAVGDELGLPVTDFGRPGGLSQIRGEGMSAEEVGVESLGVPLNDPEGGGFNFTEFPSFMWSSFTYRTGPAGGAYDPRASAGAASLVPWSAAAIDQERSTLEARQSFVGPKLRETSAGASRGHRYALLAGYSHGSVEGGSGSISARVLDQPSESLKLHLLGTDVRASAPGSSSFPSPRASLLFQRLIPVAEFRAGEDAHQLRASIFYDWSRIAYNNPDQPTFASDDRARQFGVETAFIQDRWKLGSGIRRVAFDRLDFKAPPEWLGNVSASYVFGDDASRVTPEARLVGSSRFRISPEASVSQRLKLGENSALYSKLGYSVAFPSINDRYYSSPYFNPNPSVHPEHDGSVLLGTEFKGDRGKISIEDFFQERRQALVRLSDDTGILSIQNSGRAWVESLRARGEYDLSPQFRANGSLTWSRSRLSSLGVSFPYQPQWLAIAGLGFSPLSDFEAARLQLGTRMLSSQTVGPFARLPGYGTLDFSGSWRLLRASDGVAQDGGLYIDGRVDNLFDRRYEPVLGFPAEGRVLSVALSGRL